MHILLWFGLIWAIGWLLTVVLAKKFYLPYLATELATVEQEIAAKSEETSQALANANIHLARLIRKGISYHSGPLYRWLPAYLPAWPFILPKLIMTII